MRTGEDACPTPVSGTAGVSPARPRELVGLTTLVPIEVLFAAGKQPVDLNNVFVSSDRFAQFMHAAERDGFPDTSCAWLKGIYGVVALDRPVETVVAVTFGDCSDTHALMEHLKTIGIRVVPFAYLRDKLQEEIEKLMDVFGVSWEAVHAAHAELQEVRRRVWQIDEWTWRDGTVSGLDNHIFQVEASDMGGDLEAYRERVFALTPGEPINPQGVRLGILGVPPVFPADLYHFLEGPCGAKVVFNEVQRQFSLPLDCEMVEQYRRFTYPYGIDCRLADIRHEVERRRIDGLIHYTQAFCFREMLDPLIRRAVGVPVLTLTGAQSRTLGAGLQTRLEAFVDMLTMRRV